MAKYRIEDKKGKPLSKWFDDFMEAVAATKTSPWGTRLVRDDGVVMSIKPGGGYVESKTDMKDVRQHNRELRGGILDDDD